MNDGRKVILRYVLLPLAVVFSTIACGIAFPKLVGLPLVVGITLWNLISRIRQRLFLSKNGWYAGAKGRDLLFYREKSNGILRELEIYAELGCGKPEHLVYVPSENEWDAKQPQWAHGRRVEIIGRVKSLLKEPAYEYKDFA